MDWKPDLGEAGAAGPGNASSHLDPGVKIGVRLKHGTNPPLPFLCHPPRRLQGMCQHDLQPLLSPELCLKPKPAQGHWKQPGIPPVGYFWLRCQALLVQSVKQTLGGAAVAVGAYLAGGKDTLQAGFQNQARAFCNQLGLQQHLHTAPALSSPSCSEFQESLRNGHTPQDLHTSACSPCYMHRTHPSSKAKSNQLPKMKFKL